MHQPSWYKIVIYNVSFPFETADIGGIQRTVQLWIEGDQTDVTFEYNTYNPHNKTNESQSDTFLEDSLLFQITLPILEFQIPVSLYNLQRGRSLLKEKLQEEWEDDK